MLSHVSWRSAQGRSGFAAVTVESDRIKKRALRRWVRRVNDGHREDAGSASVAFLPPSSSSSPATPGLGRFGGQACSPCGGSYSTGDLQIRLGMFAFYVLAVVHIVAYEGLV